ncbi:MULTISPECIES: AAA family ATPase [unclassified Paenibacillus]|uniref:AAA family ATPase n=1 Tax=unclassified Paenibacillus TaxID=185978 RepID=UPI0009A8BD60|nr:MULTISPECIES: AAA family ATPase [unclassified Paenibacillus]SLJ90308.1 AAA domain-containing protein [Paenibacillus sp. RU5A]SOC59037.1 AAA domain-containing protein [Paenibacillus sp. RU26A]SOC68088.1 AAA domain-containing protein [Paenibacillus sp. RU5M]
MKFIIIFGPQAVGKMTVGQELEKITDLKLFHNHMTIELVSPYFSYGTPQGKRLVNLFRQEIFEEVAKSELPGLIFTFVWAFDMKEDWEYIRKVSALFESRGAEVCYVELEADPTERLERNRSPHRLLHKATKRNVEWSEKDLLSSMEKNRLNSEPGEITYEQYIRINNTDKSPKDVAHLIQERFKL